MPIEMPCPSPDLLRRSLDPDDPMTDSERRQIEAHVDGCPRGCKQAIAALLHGQTVLLAPGGTPPVNRPDSLAWAVDEEPLPSHLGRYQIVARLGAGGMGMVWRGHDPHLVRDVAVKVPSFHGSDEGRTEARQRFLREARAAAAVRHAHVCPIYDVGEQDGRPFVVMALVEGESLAERLRREGRFEDPHAAVQLILKVAEALACVHAAHIVHRDLKPGNILLDRAGEPFLADFGLARAAEGERISSANQIVGTPAYMAPEQAVPELGTVGPCSDQYSLGVVLYQMLTGRLPFEGTAAALILQLGSRSVPPPSQHRPDLDPFLERVLLKALARLPQHRYGSVLDFAGALRAWKDPAAAAPVRRAGVAQHRRLTLLQCGCDLFDSPAILEALEPEEQHDLLVAFRQLCRDAAAPLAGIVVKTTDHGLLLCFGLPFALECAARRAVRVGLKLLEGMAAFNKRLGERHPGLHLSARVAIHSDRAVVTQDGGDAAALSIVGPLLPVVDQLERLAAPDSLVISEDTHRLLGGFAECTSLGPQKLKGAAGAKTVYRIHREARGFVECSSLIPLIGRDRETALLQERWEQASAGVSQVVLLVGEAGIGKSRQVLVQKEHVAGEQTEGDTALIVEWPCSPLHEADGHRFHAIESFEGIMGLKPQDSPSQKLDKLAAHLETLQLASPEAVALLASLLSIPLDGRYLPLGLGPQRQKEKTFDLLLDWLRAQAERQPVLFVIEDLHWAGPTTLEFLDLLVGQLQSARLLTLLTFRPDFALPWRARGHHTQVALNRLTRRQTGELMLLKSGLPTIPPRVLDQVVERTDGVPLFVEEVTAMILEAGALRVVDGQVQLAGTDICPARCIPTTLQDLLMARLDRMASDLDVVQLAATIGREFRYELLAAVVSCSEEALQQELGKLVDAELLFQHGRPPTARYQFKHALIRDAAYQAMLKKKRQECHRRIAEVLEQHFPETCATQPELLAHHFTEGNVMPGAVTYWERAAERAQECGAPGEAIGHLTRGLELIPTLPETLDRQAQQIRMHISLGRALSAARGFGVEEMEAHYARAHALCLQTGLTEQLFPALFGRLRYFLNRGMHGPAQELTEEMQRLAERQANTGFLVCAHLAVGLSQLFQGKLTEAVPHLEQVVAVEATAELRSAVHRYVLFDPWVSAHSYLSWGLWLLGFPERAAEHSRQAVSLAERLGHLFSLGLALCDGMSASRYYQTREETRAAAARARALGTEKGFVSLAAWARIVEGWALAEPGQSEQALNAIRQGLEELRLQDALSDRNELLSLLAEACARTGRPAEGLLAVAEALAFADASSETFLNADLYRLRGELLLQHDPAAMPDAEACFHQALEVARRQQARSLELRAALSLAQLWCRQGKTQPACELVQRVYAGFTEGFQTPDLQRAAAFLEQPGCSTAHS
jgi:class 3 adenylate cyclase/predicted ATPase